MRRWLSWPKAHDWKSCVRGTVPRVQIPLSAPTLRASAQSMPQKRQERNKFLLSLFVSSPMPRPALRKGESGTEIVTRRYTPLFRRCAPYKSLSPRQRFKLGLRQSKNGSLAQMPLPFLFALLPTLFASQRRIGHRNSDATLHSAIPSLRSLQIPLSAPTLQAWLEAIQKREFGTNATPFFVCSPAYAFRFAKENRAPK